LRGLDDTPAHRETDPTGPIQQQPGTHDGRAAADEQRAAAILCEEVLFARAALSARESQLDELITQFAADVAARDSALGARTAALDARGTELAVRTAQLEAHAASLGAREAATARREADVEARALALAKAQAEMRAQVDALGMAAADLRRDEAAMRARAEALAQQEAQLAAARRAVAAQQRALSARLGQLAARRAGLAGARPAPSLPQSVSTVVASAGGDGRNPPARTPTATTCKEASPSPPLQCPSPSFAHPAVSHSAKALPRLAPLPAGTTVRLSRHGVHTLPIESSSTSASPTARPPEPVASHIGSGGGSAITEEAKASKEASESDELTSSDGMRSDANSVKPPGSPMRRLSSPMDRPPARWPEGPSGGNSSSGHSEPLGAAQLMLPPPPSASLPTNPPHAVANPKTRLQPPIPLPALPSLFSASPPPPSRPSSPPSAALLASPLATSLAEFALEMRLTSPAMTSAGTLINAGTSSAAVAGSASSDGSAPLLGTPSPLAFTAGRGSSDFELEEPTNLPPSPPLPLECPRAVPRRGGKWRSPIQLSSGSDTSSNSTGADEDDDSGGRDSSMSAPVCDDGSVGKMLIPRFWRGGISAGIRGPAGPDGTTADSEHARGRNAVASAAGDTSAPRLNIALFASRAPPHTVAGSTRPSGVAPVQVAGAATPHETATESNSDAAAAPVPAPLRPSRRQWRPDSDSSPSEAIPANVGAKGPRPPGGDPAGTALADNEASGAEAALPEPGTASIAPPEPPPLRTPLACATAYALSDSDACSTISSPATQAGTVPDVSTSHDSILASAEVPGRALHPDGGDEEEGETLDVRA